jgi:hypothetical protein
MITIEGLRLGTKIRMAEDWEAYHLPQVKRYVEIRMAGMMRPGTKRAAPAEVKVVLTPGEARQYGRRICAAATRAIRAVRKAEVLEADE